MSSQINLRSRNGQRFRTDLGKGRTLIHQQNPSSTPPQALSPFTSETTNTTTQAELHVHTPILPIPPPLHSCTHTHISHSTEPSPSTFLTPLAHNQGWVTPPLPPLDSSSLHSPLPLKTRTLSPHMPHQPLASNLPASQGGNPTPATGHEPNQFPSPTHPPSGYYHDQLLQDRKAYRRAGTKFHTCQSAVLFLEECTKQNLIPSGLKIRHTCKPTLPTFNNVETHFNLILRQTERQLREALLHHYQSASRSAEKQFHCRYTKAHI